MSKDGQFKTTVDNISGWTNLDKRLKKFEELGQDSNYAQFLAYSFEPYILKGSDFFNIMVFDIDLETTNEEYQVFQRLLKVDVIPIKYVRAKTYNPNITKIKSQRRVEMDFKFSTAGPPQVLTTLMVLANKSMKTKKGYVTGQAIDLRYSRNMSPFLNINNSNSDNPNENILAFIDELPVNVQRFITDNFEIRVYQWENGTSLDNIKELEEDLTQSYLNPAISEKPISHSIFQANIDTSSQPTNSEVPLLPPPSAVVQLPSTDASDTSSEASSDSSAVEAPPVGASASAPAGASVAPPAAPPAGASISAPAVVSRQASMVNDVVCKYQLFDVMARELDLIYDIKVVQDYEAKLAEKLHEMAVSLKEDAVRVEKFDADIAAAQTVAERNHAIRLREPLARDVNERYQLFKEVKDKHSKYSTSRQQMEQVLDETHKKVQEAMECTAKSVASKVPSVAVPQAMEVLRAMIDEFKNSHIAKQHVDEASAVLNYHYNTGKMSHIEGVREVLHNEPHAMCRVTIPETKKRIDVEFSLVDNKVDQDARRKRSLARRRAHQRKHSFSHF